MKIKYQVLLSAIVSLFAVNVSAQKRPVKKTSPSAGLAAALINGKAIYTQNCLTCHQADGAGVQNMNPPLIKTTYVLGDKTRLVKILLNGFNEDVEINGETYSNAMPAFAHLSNQQIADVLSYVRNNFGNKAPAVTVADVNKIRSGK